MAFTITTKFESNKVNNNDFIILGSFLLPENGFTFHIARLLVYTFRHTTNQRTIVHTLIQFGRLITHIAMHFGWRREGLLSKENTTTISMIHLV